MAGICVPGIGLHPGIDILSEVPGKGLDVLIEIVSKVLEQWRLMAIEHNLNCHS